MSKGDKENWWENETLKNYWERARCIENQYNSTCVTQINMTLDGPKTLGEDIADHGGLEAAYLAYGKDKNLIKCL